jgi:tetratricopeptide (TPR) repeat protein
MSVQCHHFLGELALLQGRLTEARAQVEKSLRLSQSAGILRRVAATQRLLGDVSWAEGDYGEANDLYCAAVEITAQLFEAKRFWLGLTSRERCSRSGFGT